MFASRDSCGTGLWSTRRVFCVPRFCARHLHFPFLHAGEDLGRAMLQATREDLRLRVIENPEIRQLAERFVPRKCRTPESCLTSSTNKGAAPAGLGIGLVPGFRVIPPRELGQCSLSSHNSVSGELPS